MRKRVRKTKSINVELPQKQNSEIIDFGKYRKRQKNILILPRNISQEDYIEILEDKSKDIIFAIGPAGTGKSMIAVLAALQALRSGECEKIIITRPAVSVDEQHGFLPGNLVEKMAPWTRPIFDVIEEYYSPKEILTMIEENIIEVAPLAYMRGRTFKNAYIIGDELQNSTPNQMKMLLTRIGENSRIIITGDLAQHDRTYEENGLKDFINKLKECNSNRIGLVQFTQNDVERHPAVRDVLRIYGDE